MAQRRSRATSYLCGARNCAIPSTSPRTAKETSTSPQIALERQANSLYIDRMRNRFGGWAIRAWEEAGLSDLFHPPWVDSLTA